MGRRLERGELPNDILMALMRNQERLHLSHELLAERLPSIFRLIT